MVLAYSMTGRVMALYVASRVSFPFPQVVAVSAFIIRREESAFSFVIFVCSPKLKLGSNVSPSILGFLTVGIVVLFIERLSVMLCSRVFEVKRVEVDLSGFKSRSFSLVQAKMSCRYGWIRFSAVL